MSIRYWLGLEDVGPAGAGETESVRAIVRQLEGLDPERARFIAAFAYVLGRVARADLEVSAEERVEMERVAREHGGLSTAQAVLVVQIACSRNELFGATENFLVTREFGRIATREQKLALIDALFALSASDRSISAVEDHVIRRVADELRLEHGDFIAARSRFTRHRSVMQAPPGGAAS